MLVELCFTLLVYVVSINASEFGKDTYFGIRLHYLSYSSYSEQNASMPMIAGFPVLRSSALDFGLDLKYKRHEVVFEYAAPVNMVSEGGNTLSYENESRYSRFMLDYACHFELFKKGGFSGKHAINLGMLYEDRTMIYLRNSYERTRDINFYIGPRFRVDLDLSASWVLQFNFDGRFYLPYFNKGYLESYSDVQELIYESDYYAFYYQSVFSLSLLKEFSDGNCFELGIRKNNLIGYANSLPLFYIDDLIHFKFDRLYQCYIAFDFNLWDLMHHEK